MNNKYKVLIVEDETIIAMSLKLELESHDFEVLEPVASGEKALEIIKAVRPNLILLDIRLAGNLTGLDVARSQECLEKAKLIIFMTGYVTPEIKAEALKLKPVGFLEKPVEVEDVLRMLEK